MKRDQIWFVTTFWGRRSSSVSSEKTTFPQDFDLKRDDITVVVIEPIYLYPTARIDPTAQVIEQSVIN